MALKNISTQIEVNKKMSSAPRTRKPRDPTLPKPPNNGFIRYCLEMRPKIKLSNPDAKGPEILALLAAWWRAEPQSVKDKYNNEYKADKAEYDRKVKQIKADNVVEESPKVSSTEEEA